MERKIAQICSHVRELEACQRRAGELVGQILSVLNETESTPADDVAPCDLSTDPDGLPRLVLTEWIIAKLKIHPATFYRRVYRKLLFPALEVGIRKYYRYDDVKKLMVPHEKGAWTYSKMLRKMQQDDRQK